MGRAQGASTKERDTRRSREEVVMSFSIPKNVPSFSNPQRQFEDRVWSSSGVASKRSALNGPGVLGGVQRSMGDLLSPDRAALPMYKDKPYAYSPSGRRSIFRRKSVCGLFVLVVLSLIWWTNMFAQPRETAKSKLGEWGLMPGESKGKHDWGERRKRVVEAMELSWGAYERYAWGESPVRVSGDRLGPVLTLPFFQDTMNSTQSRRVGDIWRLRAWAGSSLTHWIP